ncbi:MAG: hypothetical protein NVS3B20_06780 [Polyangiales bacterium]
MGLFDFFKGGKSKGGPSDRPKSADKNMARFSEAMSKRAQNYDRQEALDALSKLGTAEAAAALLKRFTFVIEPSITDQEEKETAFRGVLTAGADALPAIREFCQRAESLTWPLRMMREILDEETYVTEVIALLSRWDTEYDRNADPKIQLLGTLEEHKDPRVVAAVERFLEDVHEPTRFHAATTLLAQDAPTAAGALARALSKEEAVRTQNRVVEGLAARGWPIPEDTRDALATKLPRGYRLDSDGVVHKR